ncbi:asparagine synthetase A [Saccharomonospora azurea]|uniref:asparagine synthetase A n=1 Tax=Saccharomonospora azurea TaxID=40988 RepID=UPI00024000BE|nr:asparagine synthetase A [Saccharomonospora azurea]EHK89311.1 asparagine synthetase A [Saccharomonospora azurea SZMC 14600]
MNDARRGPVPVREHLTSSTTKAALLVQQKVLDSVRATLADSGFVEVAMPLVGPVTDPGARGAKQADVEYYGTTYKVMTSAILYKQAALLTFDRIFSIAPNLRLEPPETATTGRHLAEFHQIDVEMADANRTEAMEVAQALVRSAVSRVLTDLSGELEELGRDSGAFAELLDRPFDAITHADAVVQLVDMGIEQNPEEEISWVGEHTLSSKATRPFFITDYPTGSRGFYDRQDPEKPGTLCNFDLIAPEGFGELASGSERAYELAEIVDRMRETGENPEKYGWYLELVKSGIRPSAGFGIGLERLTRYVTGLDEVWQVNAFPKLPGVIQ